MAKGKKPDDNKNKKPEDKNESGKDDRLEKSGKAAKNASILGTAFYTGVKAGKTTFSVTKRPIVSVAVGVAAAGFSGIGLTRGFNKATDYVKQTRQNRKPDNSKPDNDGNHKKPGDNGPAGPGKK